MKKPIEYLPPGADPALVDVIATAMVDAYNKGTQDQKDLIETLVRNTEGDHINRIQRCPLARVLHI